MVKWATSGLNNHIAGKKHCKNIDDTQKVLEKHQEKEWPNHWSLRYPTLNSCLLW